MDTFNPDAYLDTPKAGMAPTPAAQPFDPDAYLADKEQQALEQPAPPPAFDPDKYLATPKETPPPQGSPAQMQEDRPKPLGHSLQQSAQEATNTEEEYPGFMTIAGSAASRKAVESATNLMLGSQILLPKGVGGTSLEDAYNEGKVHPKTKDKIDELLEEPLSQGWTDWRWWTAQLAGNLGGVGPGLGTAGAATLLGGPLAGIAGFAGEAAIERLVPAYNAARAAGLDPDAATKQAIIDSGISAAFATAMGLVGARPLTGTLAKEVEGEVVNVLKRPLAEAFLQLSVVQPGLMAGQDIATSLSHGEAPNAEQVLTDMLVGGLAGYGIHRTFRTLDTVKGLAQRRGGEEQTPATEATIMQAAEAQRPKTISEQVKAFGEKTEPAAPVGPPAEAGGEDTPMTKAAMEGGLFEKELTPAFTPSETPNYFYSHLSNAISSEFPEKMPAGDVVPWLKKRGVKDSELEAVGIKPFLADVTGHVSKSDLLAQVESNQVQVIERVRRAPTEDPMAKVNAIYDNAVQLYGTTSPAKWPPRVQREYNQARQEAEIARKEAIKNSPKYPSQMIPGLDHNVMEYTFATPTPVYDHGAIESRAAKEWQDTRGVPWAKASEEQKRQWRESAVMAMQAEDPNVYLNPHYLEDLNAFAHTRLSFERDRDGFKSMVVHEIQSDPHQRATKAGYKSEGGKIPDLPFKSNWQDLVVKRLMMIAADRGADRLVLANGDQVGFRLGTTDPETGEFSPSESRREVEGARQNYDKKLPGLFKKYGKQYGADYGTTRFDLPNDMYARFPSTFREERRAQHDAMGIDQAKLRGDMFYITLGPSVSDKIRQGIALHEVELTSKGRTLSDLVQENKFPARLNKAAQKIDKIIRKVSNELGVSRGITINAVPMDTNWRGRLRDNFDPFTGYYVIDVNTKRILTEHDLYAAMSHEFGHVIMHNMFMTAPHSDQAAIFKAFRDFRAKFDATGAKVGDVRRLRDNAISLETGARAMHDGYRVSDLDPESKAYFLSFEEWFAEQVGKWMQTDAKPLGVVDRFFKSIGNKIRKMLAAFRSANPDAGTPEQAVADFLNSKWGMPGGWVEPIKEQHERDTILRAQEAFDKEGAPETMAVPEQASSGGGRDIIKALNLKKEGGEAMAGHGDRMNWFYDLFLSLPQIQELNPHLRQLGLYTDMHRIANWENNEIMREAHQRVQQWGMIRDPKQQLALTKFINDYANGLFKLPHTEDGIFRRPNAEEFAALVKKHGLSDQSVKLFQGITADFDKFLEKYRTLLINDARRVKDPNQAATNIQNINQTIDKLTKRPFIPLSRFGKYLITVYDSKGNIRHSEQTNSLRRQRQIVEALKKHPDRLPGDIVLPGEVPKDAAPFLGMPPGLIDLIGDKLSLSPTQKGILDQLRFDYAPGHSFKHQFRELDLVPGYSTDFMRNYAHFFFHGARHVTRVKWVDAMRDQMRSLGSEQERLSRAGNVDGANKLDKIVKYMQKHFQAWVDPKSDWASLRGMMFHWYLGFNPASAAVNLTQTPLMTYPFLASAYGDFRAMKALAKASLDLNNFYKKGTLVSRGEVTKNTAENFMARALGELVKRGTISETQAHQLAAISEDRNLLRNFGKRGEAGWLKFQEASSWMFEMTEQYNRRLAARAALELAYANPGHREVRTAIDASPILYKELTDPRGMNWTPQEAGAFLAAQRAVNKTQFEYAQYARPRIMRGPIGGTAFVFKLFAQNTLFNLLSNPAMLARWMVIMGALGGMQGLMGFENVNSLVKTLAYRLFGKDFDLEDEARHFAHDVLHDQIGSDILMHGLSAKGFGIPAVMHSMGMNWAPTVDMSKSVGFGDVIGFDPFRPLGPTKNPKEEELRQITRSVGAAFGIPLSLYDFATSNQNFTDLKKYEMFAPRFLGNLTHAFRWATEGKEVNRAGNAVVRFNVADTEQMMEILARAAGFQPRRLTEEWERIAAISDAANFWDLRRQGLMRQFAETVKTNDPEGKQRVLEAIRKFNKELPDYARTKGITSQQLSSSVQQRLKVQQRQESGLPAAPGNVPIAREVEKYYPRGWPQGLQSAKPVQ